MFSEDRKNVYLLSYAPEFFQGIGDAHGNAMFTTVKASDNYFMFISFKNSSRDERYVEFNGRNISTSDLWKMPIVSSPDWREYGRNSGEAYSYEVLFWYNLSRVPIPVYTHENKNWWVIQPQMQRTRAMGG